MIASMDRVEVICLRDALPKIVPYLHAKGLIDVEEVPLEAANVPGYLKRVDIPEERQGEIHHLQELDRILREIVPLLAVRPPGLAVIEAVPRIQAMPRDSYLGKARQWYRELRALTRRRINATDNLEILNNYRQLLDTLAPLLGARKVRFGREARAIVLKGDIGRTSHQLQERLETVIGPEVEFIRHAVNRNHLVGVLLYPESKNDAVGRILREEGIIPVDTPDKDGAGESLNEVLRRVQTRIAEQEQSLETIRRELDEYARSHGADLAAMQRVIADEHAEFQVLDRFAESQMVCVMHGWIPSDELPAFRTAVESEFPAEIVLNVLPTAGIAHSRIPTLLKNPKWLKPFEVLLFILRPPTYGTMDPTILVALSFVLFYGFIVGDAVYGVFILGFAHWLRVKWGYNQYVDSAGKVGYWMAGSSILFGILYGEYLGNAGEKLWYAMTGSKYIPGMILHRTEPQAMVPLLIAAVAIGMAHIIISLVLGVRENLRHHHKEHAMEKLGMLMGLLGLLLAIASGADVAFLGNTAFLVIGLLMYAAGAVLIVVNMGAMGVINVLEIFSLIGNTLSYARLMAVGIAGAIIANLANMLPGALPWGIGYLAAIPVHILNVGIIMFSPTLHSLRLNIVEFLPKFYTPEGRSYKPFRKEAQ